MGRFVSYAVFGFMAVAALAYMVHDNIRFAGAASWQSVPGRVVESGIFETGGGARNAKSYHVRVSYTYVIEGQRFSGDEIWLTAGSSFESPEDAGAFLAPYRAGSEITVHYDPADPTDTALIVQRGGDPMVILILAGLLGLIGTYHYPRNRMRPADGGARSVADGQPGPDEAPADQVQWGRMLRQMGTAALAVVIAFVIYVLATGPGFEPPRP